MLFKREKREVEPVTVPDIRAQADGLPDSADVKDLTKARTKQRKATVHNIGVDAAQAKEAERRSAKADQHIIRKSAEAREILEDADAEAAAIRGDEIEYDDEEYSTGMGWKSKLAIVGVVFGAVATLNDSAIDAIKGEPKAPTGESVVQSLKNTGTAISATYGFVQSLTDTFEADGKYYIQLGQAENQDPQMILNGHGSCPNGHGGYSTTFQNRAYDTREAAVAALPKAKRVNSEAWVADHINCDGLR